ncbi:hypothetical protein R3P38DRAFT_2819032 [Favolaschia claudopus]|uniref:Uncharacterized protein n=1 Tax=Favolaschia claudopus TaxID=2862362 RepID=A0AAW0EEZ4_9AGAR
MHVSELSTLPFLFALVTLFSDVVRAAETTRTLVAPAIGITSVSVLGVEGGETTFALYQTANDGATTFIQTMVADATSIANVFPVPSFGCNFHETAKGKMRCIEADSTSTATISVDVQTLLYAVDDALAGATSSSTASSATQSTGLGSSSSTTSTNSAAQSSTSTPLGSLSTSSASASETFGAPSTVPSSGAIPLAYKKWAVGLGLVAALMVTSC